MSATPGRSILRDPAFGRLWLIQASTPVGGNVALYALTNLVFQPTRSNAAVSALVMSFLVPSILLSTVAGVVVDRLDVRWAMFVPNSDSMSRGAGASWERAGLISEAMGRELSWLKARHKKPSLRTPAVRSVAQW